MKYTIEILFILSLCSTFTSVFSYPNSVPPTKAVCSSMTPGHGPHAQERSTNPYQITVNKVSVHSGNNVQLTLNGVNGDEFIGFFIQARDPENNPLGEFLTSELVKVNSCNGRKKNGAHHSGNASKKEIIVFWKSPTDYEGPITFTGTFVKNFETFWTQVKSKEVVVGEAEV